MSVWLECPAGHSWQTEEVETHNDSQHGPQCPLCGSIGAVRRDETVSEPALALSEAEPLPSLPGFEVLRKLGRGGMGVVYLARQEKLGRLVAVKVIRTSAWSSGGERQRFLREARLVSQLTHPGIVGCHTIGEHGGCPFFVMEYVEGGSLADVLAERRGQPTDWREAARLVEQLARALQHAHERGIVHRDLKPANVLLFSCGSQNRAGENITPKLTDFGLAKQMEGASALTHSGAVMGTPAYMAPEQAAGKTSEIGPASDVHALGVILYELLTGKRPFAGEMLVDILSRVRDTVPVSPRKLRPEVPTALEAICLKCLAKRPVERYATAGPLAEDLAAILEGGRVSVRPRRRRRWLALAGGLLILALGVGIGLTLSGRNEEAGASTRREARESARKQARLALAEKGQQEGQRADRDEDPVQEEIIRQAEEEIKGEVVVREMPPAELLIVGDGPPPPELKKVHVLLLFDTNFKGLAKGLLIDKRRMIEVWESTVPRDHYTLTVLEGDKATRKSVLDYYDNLAAGKGEGLVCFHAGNGARDVKTKEHFLQFLDGTPLLRSDLVRAMKAKRTDLTVLLTDACSTPLDFQLRREKEGAAAPKPTDPPAGKRAEGAAPSKIIPTMKSLFFQSRGAVDITAATDNASWSDNFDGGVFTRTLCRLLLAPVKGFDKNEDEFVDWYEFFEQLQSKTQSEFLSWRKRMIDGGEMVDQRRQVPMAFGTLPKQERAR